MQIHINICLRNQNTVHWPHLAWECFYCLAQKLAYAFGNLWMVYVLSLEFAAVLKTPITTLISVTCLAPERIRIWTWLRSVSIRAVFLYFCSQDILHFQMFISSWNFLTSPDTMCFCSTVQVVKKDLTQVWEWRLQYILLEYYERLDFE